MINDKCFLGVFTGEDVTRMEGMENCLKKFIISGK
jgi:hypothetical protein